MRRLVLIFGLTLVALGGAVAGTIVPVNLTTSPVYVGTCTSPCTPTASATNVGGTFESTLFSNVDKAAGAPAPSSSPQNVTTAGSGTIPFILAAQSASPFDDTFLSTTGQSNALVVDFGSCTGLGAGTNCGLFNVDDVYTMIQANGEAFNTQGITITLTGWNPNTPLLTVTDTINLTAGVDYRGWTNGGTVTCTDANATSNSSCSGANSDTASVSGTDSSVGGGNTVVTSNNVFGAQTLGSTNYYLDVQSLELGTNFLGDYLNSITITNSPTSGTEKLLFSGVSVDEVPEPGTVSLFGIGLGLIALWSIRGRRAKTSPVVE